jgi:hypothetical protein
MTPVSFTIIVLVTLFASAALADGEVCSANDKKRVEGALRKAEEAEKAGQYKNAYQIAGSSFGEPACVTNGYHRRDGLIERTSKKLGAEAEKAGRYGEAFKYYSEIGLYADADRTMLRHAKANPDDYKVVSQAVAYFDRREGKSHLKEVRALARSSGDKALAKEEKSFSARKDSLDDLQKAQEWLWLVGDEKSAGARAEQRGDALLAEGTIRSVDLAFSYFNFAGNPKKTNAAKGRARNLGDDAARRGDAALAARFYDLSGDHAKAKAVEKQQEMTEAGRQDQFKKEQKALERELGL